jgi:hypothetical protein
MASLKWKGFSGLNNKLSPEDLAAEELSHARNVDINRKGGISRRSGYASLLSGSYHSLWASLDESICLGVKTGTLYRINTDWTATLLRSNVTDNRMDYAFKNGKAFYTNNVVIGYIEDGANNLFATPSLTFKRAPFPGKLIECYRGRIYIGKANVMFHTDALGFRIDMRKGFKQFAEELTMIKAVDSGLFVSDTLGTYFLGGPSPFKMSLRKVEDAAIYGTAASILAEKIKPELSGLACVFTTTNGVCLGMGDGTVINLSQNKYKIPTASQGAGLLRDSDDMRQYIARLYN